MSQSFQCPNCNAPIDFRGGPESTIRCQYCGTSVIVPAELRSPPPISQETAEAKIPVELQILVQLMGAEKARALKRDQIETLRQVKVLTAEGKKIQAIKAYREIFNVGLKEAKDFVDALEQRL